MAVSKVGRKAQAIQNGLGEELKQARQRAGYSQSQMADLIGFSGRQAYAEVEKGGSGLSLDQAIRLVGRFPEFRGLLESRLGVSAGSSVDDRLKLLGKYRQMILSAIRFGASSDGKIPKTKLAKLVYLADFIWYYRELKPMSGLNYIKFAHGPVPMEYFYVLAHLEDSGVITREDKGKAIMLSLTEPASPPKDLLTATERQLIEKLGKYWAKKQTSEIVDFTHQQLPWQICRDDEVIPYGLITQEDQERVYGGLKL